jgi:hypothetical protein
MWRYDVYYKSKADSFAYLRVPLDGKIWIKPIEYWDKSP